MINEDLFVMHNGFDLLRHVNGNLKFNYAMSKNRQIIEQEVGRLKQAILPNSQFEEFRQERIAIKCKYAEIDSETKQPKKMVNGDFVIEKEKTKECIEELNKLNKKYKDLITQYEENMKEFENLLKQDVNQDIENSLMKLNFNDLPQLTQEQLDPFIGKIIL